MANVRDTNLNLLVAFDALMAERSVTRAAARVGLTQPAMSNVLAQLRALFDDPLFVRVAHGMEPTPRALELAEPIRRGIEMLQAALTRPAAFDPATSNETFLLAMSDHAELVLLPRLLGRLGREAPGIDLQVLPWGLHEAHPGLARGEIDAMISFYEPAAVPPGHQDETLLTDTFLCMVRRDHPSVGSRLTLRTFVELSHVLVTERPHARSVIDDALERLGHRRRIGARVPRFFIMPHVVAQTDMIASIDSRVARHYADWLPIKLLRPPREIEFPQGRIGMLWHERTHTDPARSWLRRLIREESAAV
jgi:DNA-binding transcriptional LysR family regulator